MTSRCFLVQTRRSAFDDGRQPCEAASDSAWSIARRTSSSAFALSTRHRRRGAGATRPASAISACWDMWAWARLQATGRSPSITIHFDSSHRFRPQFSGGSPVTRRTPGRFAELDQAPCRDRPPTEGADEISSYWVNFAKWAIANGARLPCGQFYVNSEARSCTLPTHQRWRSSESQDPDVLGNLYHRVALLRVIPFLERFSGRAAIDTF